MVSRLANFQPLDSAEYRRMEDMAVEELRRNTSNFDDLLEG
ncbi:unknown [Eggerthella sp. CAG:209]|nr:unknown [Eggerthella sp. CAG:209]